MLPAELDDALLTRLCCRDLSEQIALTGLGIAYIGLEELHDRRAYAVRGRNQNRRNAHGFLKRVDGLGEIAARPGAANIRPVCKAYRKRDDIAVNEDRPHHLAVVQMVATERAKIVDQHVAILQAAPLQTFMPP